MLKRFWEENRSAIVLGTVALIGAFVGAILGVWGMEQLGPQSASFQLDGATGGGGTGGGEQGNEEPEDFGPAVMLKPGVSEARVWVYINAADSHGATIDGLEKNDRIIVETVTGCAWFSDQSGWDRVQSTILGASGDIATVFNLPKAVVNLATSPFSDSSTQQRTDKDPGKARDGYGRAMNGDFAKNEGGVIVCLPGSGGPEYAHNDNHLDDDAESQGRLSQYFNGHKGCKFLVRPRDDDYGFAYDEKVEFEEGGPAHFVAFDSDHEDNHGHYELKVRIVRGRQSASNRNAAVRQQPVGDAPEARTPPVQSGNATQ